MANETRIRSYEFRTEKNSIFGYINFKKDKSEYIVELETKEEKSILYNQGSLEEAVKSLESLVTNPELKIKLPQDLSFGWSGQNMIYAHRLPEELK